MQNDLLSNQSINQAIKLVGWRTIEVPYLSRLRRHLLSSPVVVFPRRRLHWVYVVRTGLVSVTLIGSFVMYVICLSLPKAQDKAKDGRALYCMCFFCLRWIPRHSPKVVKAASQVLNSMWQYRDLRSLYKKVKSARPRCLYKHKKCLSRWCFSKYYWQTANWIIRHDTIVRHALFLTRSFLSLSSLLSP